MKIKDKFNKKEYYYKTKYSGGFYQFNKIRYCNINNYCYYSTYNLKLKGGGRYNHKHNLKSFSRLSKANKNQLLLAWIKPAIIFNDIKKFSGGGVKWI